MIYAIMIIKFVNIVFAAQHVASRNKTLRTTEASTFLHLWASLYRIKYNIQGSHETNFKSASTFWHSIFKSSMHNIVFLSRLFASPLFVQLVYQVTEYIFTFLFYNHPT